jgi:hypothetical protein
VRHQHVGPPVAAQAHQRADGGPVRPARHHSTRRPWARSWGHARRRSIEWRRRSTSSVSCPGCGPHRSIATWVAPEKPPETKAQHAAGARARRGGPGHAGLRPRRLAARAPATASHSETVSNTSVAVVVGEHDLRQAEAG